MSRKICPGVTCGVSLLVLASLCPRSADSKTLYVNGTTGSDSVSYATNSESTPWRTIGRAVWGSSSYSSPNAAQAAQPGDVVLISQGIYWEGNGGDTNPTGARYRVILNPANSGTASQPITIRGVGTVEIRIINGVRGPMIGCNSRNYVIWDNVFIDDTYGGSREDTGPVVFHATTGCQLINSTVMGHNGSYHWGYPTYGANYRLVSIDGNSSYVLIRNNRISRAKLGTGPGGQNEACIMLYDASDNIMEHNVLDDCGTGIFVKDLPNTTLDRNILRFNLVTNCHSGGLRVHGYYTRAPRDNRVYQNIVRGCDTGAGIRVGWGAATNTLVVNNTLVNNGGGGIYLQSTDMVNTQIYNNVVVGPGPAVFGTTNATPGTQSFTANRNLYYNVSPFANYDGTTYTWSQWQTTFGKDPNSPHGINPLFINASANDYRLQSGSQALTLGRAVGGIGGSDGTVIPAGAYITGNEVIGPLSGNQNSQNMPSGDLTAPDPVQNLRVIP